MGKILIATLVIYSFTLFSCTGHRSKCDNKDIICKSKELIEVLKSDHYLDADKYFLFDEQGAILGNKRDFYLPQFKGIHEDLVRNGLPNDSSYRMVRNSMQGNDVVVTLIDSSKRDKDWALERMILYFNYVERFPSAVLVGFFIDGKASEERTEKGNKELKELMKKHPYPKGFDNSKAYR